MPHLLDNPVYHALTSGDRHLGFGTENVRSFDEEVSPFAGFRDGYADGFNELYEILPTGRYVLFATPEHIKVPLKWKLIEKVEGIQMIYEYGPRKKDVSLQLQPLTKSHVDEMIALAQLTKPGPFGKRTIEFGQYFGVFENGRLVAMAGQRMHLNGYTEISAVCTHPSAAGKGYASALVQQQLSLIGELHLTPFLHVRADNSGAIKVYERLGFRWRSAMNFYFMRKEEV